MSNLVAPHQTFRQCLTLQAQHRKTVVGSRHPLTHAIDGVFHMHHSLLDCIRDRLRRSSRLGWKRLVRRERVSVDKGVPRSPSFDLAQADKIALFEAAIPMSELPEGRIRRTTMEDIADLVKSIHIELSYK